MAVDPVAVASVAVDPVAADPVAVEPVAADPVAVDPDAPSFAPAVGRLSVIGATEEPVSACIVA